MELEEGAEAPEVGTPIDGEESPEIEQPGEQETEYTPLSTDDLAAEMGWTPKDTWRGDPAKWKPSDEFLKSTVNVNKNLSGSLKSLERQVQTMAATSAKLTEAAVKKARDEAMAKRQEAFETGDAEAFEKADQELKSVASEPVGPSPEGAEFAQKHASWFQKDEAATQYALRRADYYANDGLPPAKQIAAVERDMKEHFPEYFPDAPQRAKAVQLNNPGGRGAVPAAKGFTSLPKDVQAAALDYEKRGVCTKEDYAKTYYEEMAG